MSFYREKMTEKQFLCIEKNNSSVRHGFPFFIYFCEANHNVFFPLWKGKKNFFSSIFILEHIFSIPVKAVLLTKKGEIISVLRSK